MRRFLIKTSIYSLIILAILVGVNYFGDAARIFDDEYEKKIADIILSGKPVTNIDNFDERLLQEELVKRLNSAPNVVVIGSSRTMLINSNYFPGQTLFNNSVSGASIEDLAAIYQCYKTTNHIPKKIILGVDPWTLNANNNLTRWKSIAGYYNRFTQSGDTAETKGVWEKYEQLISPSYFQNSVKLLHKIGDDPRPATTLYNKTNTKLADGSLVYSNEYRTASKQKIEDKVRKYTNGEVYGVEGFNKLSPTAQKVFTAMLADMKQHGIEVEICLVPYHPEVYPVIEQKFKTVLAAEQYIKNVAANQGIKVYGSFNPAALGLNKEYFYDGMHCKEAGMQHIMTL